MYLNFFNIKEAPFSITPDPRFLYLSPHHQEALAHLLYAVTGNGGFVMLSGEVGAGKTTLCRSFLEHLPDNVDVALILNPRLDEVELMSTILDELSIARPSLPPSLKTTFDALNAYLLKAHANHRRTVLIIDEAQNLSPSLLELIRLLTNLETAKTKLLQIILIGQPELEEILSRPELRQISQRITARYALSALTSAQTSQYIAHRLSVAGLPQALFSARALRVVYRYSGGIPRLINTLCDRALLGAYVNGQHGVNAAIVKKALGEVLGGTPPRTSRWHLGAVTIGIVATLLLAGGIWTIMPETSRNAFAQDARTVLRQIRANIWEKATPLLSSLSPAKPDEPSRLPAPRKSLSRASSPAPSEAVAGGGVTQGGGKGRATQSSVLRPQSPPSAPSKEKRPPAVVARPPVPLPAPTPIPTNTLEGAYNTLFRLWGKDYTRLSGFTPCEKAASVGLGCLRGKGTLHTLETMNLPALVRLQGTSSTSGSSAPYGIVSAVDGGQITVAEGLRKRTISRSAFRALWDGNYVSIWPTPKGVRPMLRQGMRGPDVGWLSRTLERVASGPQVRADIGEKTQSPPLNTFDADLVRRVRRFQSAQGLPNDGVAGPQTIARLLSILGWSGTPTLHSPAGQKPQMPVSPIRPDNG